jgi:hypothetical protein
MIMLLIANQKKKKRSRETIRVVMVILWYAAIAHYLLSLKPSRS